MDTTQNNGFYKIQSDGALNSARTAISSSGAYDFTNMYAYISAGYVDIISKAKATTVSVEYEAHVQDVGWQGSVSDGEVAGTVGQNKKIEALAIDVLNLSRNTLVINLRFMDKAISMLKCQCIPGINAIAVNGRTIFYDPITVLKSFSKEKKQVLWLLPCKSYVFAVS